MATEKNKDGRPGKAPTDNLYIAAAIGVILVMLWFAMRAPIVWMMTHARSMELAVISMVYDGATPVRTELNTLAGEYPGSTMGFRQFHRIAEGTGFYTRWLWVALMVPASVCTLFFGNKMERYKRDLSPESLARSEAKLWPEITPTVGLSLTKGDIKTGPWAVAMTEWEFAKLHKLTDAERVLDRTAAKRVFAAQLGSPWRGPKALPKHARAIYAALSLCINGRRDECVSRLRQMAGQFGTDEKGSVDNMDLSWVDAAIQSTASNKLIKMVQQRHAYNFTVMATMLQVSRADGVMASALLIWLRPVDRRLWYVLNGVGRYAFFPESAGIMAHWLFEKTMCTKVLAPAVGEAVKGFEDALDEFLVEDENERVLH